ncbi:hypothetical protein M446_6749 [Methylobacterium sp. 4-46]|uniref:hypothetical protein n=1 Tax=unclassified Methylobacterium TaxID=2615210 RepID=UPI000165CD0D|nr:MULTISPECIES: hypothetical protein [Methylobacterium]ACA20996.1 hypothetical protein M446_6749 [Methylobacterium sp. 4-46]WFT80151.1 hypothetical protein QA634_34085 [Methylobacterium nodulans]
MFRSAGLVFIVLTTSAALGGEFPRYDIEATCRAAPALAGGTGNVDRNCLRDEAQARTQVEQQWAGFQTRRRDNCVQETSIGGPPSYVALLTCLQM